jgi:phospholipid/cholesterol/gamma-HCH transport system substrate-binding protein
MPRTRSLAWSELKVGIVAVAAVALAGFLVLSVGGQGFSWQQYSIKTRFTDVLGLKTGAVVRVAGVEVGTVDDMVFTGAEVEVTLTLQKDVQPLVTDQSVASVGSLGLLGSAVVDIVPAASGTPLQEGAMLRARRTPGQLADVADSATRSLTEATKLVQDLRAGKGTVGRLFVDDTLYKEFTTFVQSTERVIDALNTSEGTLGRLINDPAAYASLKASLDQLSGITGAIARGEGSLGKLLKDDQIAASLGRASASAASITGRIEKGEGTLGKLVTNDALFTRLDALTTKLDGVATKLGNGEGTAGKLLADKQLYENMNGAVSELRGLLTDVRRDPKKFLNVKVSLF